MQTLNFLQLVTPEQGQKAVVVPRGTSKISGKALWFHFAHTDHESMVNRLGALNDKHIYFALGGFKHGAINEYKGRKQENVEYLRSLWMDIDISPDDPKKYPTKRAAGEALSDFVRATGLPEPLVVMSGGGLHVYWPLTSDVTRYQWKPVATALKNAAQAHKLLVDHSRTSDEASILRPVGTFNNKTDIPREVRAIQWDGQPVSIESLAELLQTAASVLTPSHAFAAVPDTLGMNLANVEIAPKSFKRIIDKCAQMSWAYDHMQYGEDGRNNEGEHGESVSEPLWRACLSIAVRCKGGEKHAHTFSSKYPTYSIQETQAKIDGVGDRPQTCAKFNELNPGKCGGCRYAGRVKSPIVLGIDHVELEPPKVELAPPEVKIEADTVVPQATAVHGFSVAHHELKIAGMNPPYPYKRTDKGVVKVVPVPAVDAEGKVLKGVFVDEDKVLAPYDIYPLFRTREVAGGTPAGRYAAYWRIVPVDHKGMVDDVYVTHADLMGTDTLRRVMAETAVYTPTDNQHKEVAEYMRVYLQRLGEQYTHPQPSSFAWQTDTEPGKPLDEQTLEFVHGKNVYKRTQVEGEWRVTTTPIHPSPAMMKSIGKMQSRGSLEGWAKAASWYREDFAKTQIAAVLLAAGSPFMRYLKGSGVITMIHGQPGVGKSQVVALASSFWGPPGLKGYCEGGVSTLTGMETLAETLNNLPVICDDRPLMEEKAIAAEIMMLANGTGKGRGTVGGSGIERDNTKFWLSNCLMSSNHGWLDAINRNKLQTGGETARLIDLEIARVHRDKWIGIGGEQSEDTYKELLRANHGVVGPAMIQEFLRAPQLYKEKLLKIEKRILDLCEKLAADGHPDFHGVDPTDYRLQAAAFACGLLALNILRKLGVVTWTSEVYSQVAVDALAGICRLTKDNRPTKQDILSQYINEFHGNFVIVTSEGVRLNGIPSAVEGEQAFGKVPNTRIVGRIDHVEKITHLDRAAFKNWLGDKGVPESAVLKGLEAEGWDVRADRNTKVTLGRGFSAVSKVQTRVIELRNAALFDRLTSEK